MRICFVKVFLKEIMFRKMEHLYLNRTCAEASRSREQQNNASATHQGGQRKTTVVPFSIS